MGLLVAGADLFADHAAAAAGRLGISVLAVGVLLAGAEPEELVTAVLASAQGRPGLAAGDALGANLTMLTAALGLAALARPLPVGRRTRQYAVGAAVAGLLGVLLAGAEPEELVTAVLASAQGRPGLAAGDALGANLTMLTAALGLAALARPLPVGRRTRQYAVGAAVAGLLAVLVLLDGRVGRAEGGLLLLAYAAGVIALWRRERTPPVLGELAEVDGDEPPGARALLLVVAGLVLMTAGGAAAVEGATRLVDSLGRTDEAVGLVVLGLATTAELFALVLAAARAGVEEVAVAAVVGSAAYNATTTLGAAAVVAPLQVEGLLVPAVAAAALPLVVVLLGRSGHLGRPAGAVLAAAYALFVGLVVTGL